MKVRLLVFSRKNTHLWYSWFQAKRSTLPLSASIIEATYDDHFATLTKEDSGDDGTIDAIFADKTFMSVLERVRKIFNRNYASSPAFDRMSASTSACFEQSRGKGGQNGELCRVSGVPDFNIGELVAMVWTPAGYCSGERRLNTVFEVRRPFGSDRWKTLREHLLARDPDTPISCTIQAVLEPNKVRVISKGEALPYYSCRPIQKALHSAMREMPPFRLIGRPFCPTDMIDLAANARADWEWFSVDYSAATDGLSWKYSGRIFRYLMQDLPPQEYATAMSVLGPHRLHYPVRGGKPVFRGLQRNGQLMGSILSFPILCLANLGVYLLTTQPSHRGWSHEERLNHVLINGDDMVYAAHPALWPVHVDNGEKVGLKMSVGKAYRHPVYANVNSTSVHYDLRKMPVGLPRRDLRWEPTPYQINYLNAGLFFGQHKVQERVELQEEADQDVPNGNDPRVMELARAHMGQDPSKGLVVNLPCVLSGSLPGAQTQLLKKFLNVHHDDIRRECFAAIKKGGRFVSHTRNLFLPLCVGGMGVQAPLGWTFKVTHADRHVARVFANAPYARTSQYPLPLGYPLSDVDQQIDCPWLKPQGDPLDVLEIKTRRDKLSKSKTLAGWVFYSPTFAKCGIVESAPRQCGVNPWLSMELDRSITRAHPCGVSVLASQFPILAVC